MCVHVITLITLYSSLLPLQTMYLEMQQNSGKIIIMSTKQFKNNRNNRRKFFMQATAPRSVND